MNIFGTIDAVSITNTAKLIVSTVLALFNIDQIPYVDSDTYVAYNNEKDAILYELWVGSDGNTTCKIYYSDLPWPIGKILYLKQVYNMKQLLGIAKDNAERREEEIYRRATAAYKALSTRLGEDSFFSDNRPTSLDAIFIGHALITLYALPETSVLRGKLLEQANLVNLLGGSEDTEVEGDESFDYE
ncbi:hypothetical protein E3N88_19971 [Mikania micrantha]|uniref:Metaxin glutathione S-transferase domain-containing protein n=1 Tax=Mikania micrantha TaxID=192012 RepID=A0A5N6NGY0_9ASTR|nr:hypothetical protein E3N88_19971 [Mikania micrantha]